MFKKSFFSLLVVSLLACASHAYIGGTKAPKGGYPSTVFMQVFSSEFCTGVVVGKRMILTAAHCVTGSARYQMYLAQSLNLLTTSQETGRDSRQASIKNVYIHPAWPQDLNTNDKKSLAKYNIPDKDITKLVDLAMIEFSDDLNLPIAKIDYKPLNPGDTVTMGGYGCRNDRGEGAGSLYVSLKKVQKYIHNDFTTGPSNVNDAKTGFLCMGDSGGPVFRGKSQDIVVGINTLLTKFWIFKGRNYGTRMDIPSVRPWVQSVFAGKAPVYELSPY